MSKDRSVQTRLGPGAIGSLERGDVPRVYCATGTATCDDLDLSQDCQCPKSCEVYREHDLTQWKYCERGSAAMIG
jgi:hypothetical protein